jgi:hypothetical protein
MPRKQQEVVEGYSIFLGRYASYVIHNELNGDRAPVIAALKQFLKAPPSSFEPRTPIYYASPYTHEDLAGPLGLVFAADAPTDEKKNVIVLAVQLPLSPKTAQPGTMANCHLTTEIWPAENHSFIPVTCEFARGTIPAKRLNYSVSHGDNACVRIKDSDHFTTGFKHFVSAAYSQYGLAVLDFQLSVRHRPPQDHEFPEQEFGRTKEDFLAILREELTSPLEEIKKELNKDKRTGRLAPKNLTYLDTFFETVLDRTAELAYTNLLVYKEERVSHINPGLQQFKYGGNVVVPPSEEVIAEQTEIARVLVQRPGALELILMLADVKSSQLDEDLSMQVSSPNQLLETVEALRDSGLVTVSNTTIQLTDQGLRVVEKLRKSLTQQEEGNDALYRRSGKDSE